MGDLIETVSGVIDQQHRRYIDQIPDRVARHWLGRPARAVQFLETVDEVHEEGFGAVKASEAEIAAYLNDGFTPDFDSAGGHMAAVIENLAKLPSEDREAIAAYLRKVSPVE